MKTRNLVTLMEPLLFFSRSLMAEPLGTDVTCHARLLDGETRPPRECATSGLRFAMRPRTETS